MSYVSTVKWDSASLQDAIVGLRERRGDSAEIEVKSAAGGAPTLGPTLCAFANMPEGGTIILGLDEAAGFVPVDLSSVASLEQAVSDQARTSVVPALRCEFQTFQVSGKPVLVVEVMGLPLTQRPARHGGKAYLRQTDGDYVMSEQELAQLELTKTQAVRPTQPDRQPVQDSSITDLDAGLVASYLAAARAASRRYAAATDEQILLYTGVTTRSGEVSLAGLYAMGQFPQSASPNLGITAAAVPPRGADGARTRDLVHLVGPIPDLLDEAMAWVLRNTRTTMGYDDRGHGVDHSELPMRAVREIVANALVHRNLDPITDSKRVEIRLLNDQLVIASPGGLWGVSESQLGRPGAKSAVNPVLYEICKFVRMADASRVIEGEGGGIREAIHALTAAGLRPPRFIDNGLQFTVIISRHSLVEDADLVWLRDVTEDVDLSSEERAILVSMRHGGVWNNVRVRQEFAPIDSTAARRLLQRLVEAGLAVADGERRQTSYRITPSLSASAQEDLEVLETTGRGPTSGDDSTAPPPQIKHSDSILGAVAKASTLHQILGATGLTEGQVRYALKKLIDNGDVVMLGSQGVRATRYERAGGHRA